MHTVTTLYLNSSLIGFMKMASNAGEQEDVSPPVALVTGASGFIASHIVQQLLKAGSVRVRGTVRSLKTEEKVVPLLGMVPDAPYPLQLVEAELLDEECWVEALAGVTYVYHVASSLRRKKRSSVRQSKELLMSSRPVWLQGL